MLGNLGDLERISQIAINPDATIAALTTTVDSAPYVTTVDITKSSNPTFKGSKLMSGYVGPIAIVGPSPLEASGKRIEIKALLKKSWANQLTWTPIADAIYYTVYQTKGQILYQGLNTTFIDPNTTSAPQTYYITWTNKDNTTSAPTTVVIQ